MKEMHTEVFQLEQPENQLMVPSPLPVRILNKGPEYFRQQNEFSNCGGLSARERLAADKYKYVKSCNGAPPSPTSDAKPVLSANSCALNCDNNNTSQAGCNGLVSLNNARNDWENSPRPTATLHRSGSKRQQPRPDSLLIYRRRNEELTIVKDSSETADGGGGGGGGGRGKNGNRNGGGGTATSFLRRLLQAAHMKERLSPSNSSAEIQAGNPGSNDEDQRSGSSPSTSPPLSPTSEAPKGPLSPVIIHTSSEDDDNQPKSPNSSSGGHLQDQPSPCYPPDLVDELGSVIRKLERSPRRVTSPPARLPPGAKSRAIYRSKSDLTARCSRSASDNERFFNFCGLEAEDIEAFAEGRMSWASPDGSNRGSFHFRSVSMVELEEPDAEEMSRRSEKDPNEDDEEDDGSANLPTTSVSIIERNARVIKWIYACRRALGALKKD
ncbi:protein FAM110B-like [Petromyzon marinus]|uniref:Protein FAM110B-like n=1 Tax=Petromyzon marinus TaxID=7757 RepID=A0AAJ7U5E2_PETMA|nr:protein FAM110B-like [Petromyzon marinus]